jgi:hypothetical protein
MPPPRVVGTCDNLAAPGKWESIQPPDAVPSSNWKSSGFALDPLNAGTVYVGTFTTGVNPPPGKGVFKTTNCGSTWTHVSTGKNGDKIDGGSNWFIAIDPFDSKVIYTNTGYFATLGIYKSTNGGVDWNETWPPPNNPGIGMMANAFVKGGCWLDPYDHNHMLISFHGPCGGGSNGCLGETKDAGATWRLIFGNPAFEVEVVGYFLDNSQTWLATSNGSLWRTTDSGGTWSNVAPYQAGGHSEGNLYRAKTGVFYLTSKDGMFRSADGISWAPISGAQQWMKGVVGNGTTMWASGSGGHITAPEGDGTKWTTLPSDVPSHNEGCLLAYEPDHKILYSSCQESGFWRVVLP